MCSWDEFPSLWSRHAGSDLFLQGGALLYDFSYTDWCIGWFFPIWYLHDIPNPSISNRSPVYIHWLVVCNMNFIFPYIGKNQPNWRTHIFQRGRAQPTSSTSFMTFSSFLGIQMLFMGFSSHQTHPKNRKKTQVMAWVLVPATWHGDDENFTMSWFLWRQTVVNHGVWGSISD